MNINYARRPRIVYNHGGLKVINYKYNDARGTEYRISNGINTFSLRSCPILNYDYLCKLMQQYRQDTAEKISADTEFDNFNKKTDNYE